MRTRNVACAHVPCSVPLNAGVIQCSDRDEFSYQEMMAHIPLCAMDVSAAEGRLAG